jgi:hypothetical protein
VNGTSSVSSQQRISKVKITSPTRGQQIPAGKDLAVSGTSIDNATAKCEVSVIVNNVKPYQPAISTVGPGRTGGAADYSKWKFDITSKYTTIKPGQNKITARFECEDNSASKSFSSVLAIFTTSYLHDLDSSVIIIVVVVRSSSISYIEDSCPRISPLGFACVWTLT